MNIIKKLNKQGFSHVELFGLIAVLVIIVGVGGYIVKESHAETISVGGRGAATLTGNWTPVGHMSTKETSILMYACVNETSLTQWTVDGMAVMNPAVKDTSAYTFYTARYTSTGTVLQKTGSNVWGTYSKPLSARVSFTVDPFASNLINDYVNYSNGTIIGQGGGPAIPAGELVACQTQTPIGALTSIVSGLYDGSQEANVTAKSISIPGPISTATGRPIVFTVSGKTYFAYTQEQQPNFTTTPAKTAQSMAIVSGNNNNALVPANLDKAGILVDANGVAVGYSTGGN